MRRDRDGLLEIAGAILVGALLACSESPQPDEPAPREPAQGSEPAGAARALPNIVIYLVDTLRADHLGAYGYTRPTSPQLDAFARDAVLFERAYSPTSWTRPAIGTLLTGLPPAAHGAVTRSTALGPDVVSLAQRLRARGYHTAAFVTNPNVLPIWGFDRGFDVFRDIESVKRSATADQVNEAVFDHLAGDLPEPFFLYIHTRDPHSPYEPPEPWASRFGGDQERDAYDGEIAFNDEHFGAMLGRLRALGHYRDSVILFASDHGDEFGEHAGQGHGHTLFEELVRVPLVLKQPGNQAAGRRITTPVRLSDVVPTLLALAGADPAPELPGLDLRDVVRSSGSGTRPHFFALTLVDSDGHKNVADGVLLGDQKLIEVYEPERRTLLFDLARDPGERESRDEEDPETRAALQRLLAEERAAASAGIHLWLVGDGLGQRAPDGVAKGRLTTEGHIVSLEGVQLEEGDRLWLSEDSRTVTFEVTLKNRRNPTGVPYKLVDRDTLVVRLEPPDAGLSIEALTIGGEEAAIFIGPAHAPLGSAPVAVPVGSPALQVQHMESLFEATKKRSIAVPAGAYVGQVAPRRRQEVEMPAELDERLRALGYVE